MRNPEQLLEQWHQEEEEPFEGWDFSYLKGRMIEDGVPWSYLDRAADLMQNAKAVVDLDTGGGEKLLTLRPDWPQKIVATESYPPNVKIAAKRLEPFGVIVLNAESNENDSLPFVDNEFDLVLNRHGAFNSLELARILTEGGTFLTRQVHGRWAWDLVEAFDAELQFPDAAPERDVPLLERAGLTIVDQKEWWGKIRFTDVGAIVYYLKAIPWTVSNFSVDRHRQHLFALQEQLTAGQPLEYNIGAYLIEAKKLT